MSNKQAIASGAALSAFSGDSQHNRLVRLEFPFRDGPQVAILLVNTLHAHEEVSRGFRLDVEVLSDDPRIPLKSMMARMVTLSLVREDGSLRYFNGYVTQFRFRRADGGFAFYQMVLEPWLAFTHLRQECIAFHGKSVREITEETFKHYRQADWRMLLSDDDPRLTVANQYNETDHQHLHRRWEARGLHYWYEHRFDGHKLILSDTSLLAEPIDATGADGAGVLPFRATGASAEDDGISLWSAVRHLGSGKTTFASFDYKNPVAQRADVDSVNQQGDVFPYEVYEDTGAYGFRLRTDGETLAQQRMVERDKTTQYFEAESNARAVQPGRSFQLGGHFSAEPRSRQYDPDPRPAISGRSYLILTVDHHARNNNLSGRATPHYDNQFTCLRRDIRWRPGPQYNSTPGPNPGILTALVVGPAGAQIHTDGHGRVKVQFHWDRLGNYDDNSSPWIRVMTPAAGNQFGQIRLPRVGEEVTVCYPNGNIDHPLILGMLYNTAQMPPWQLPAQAALSGLRSQELGAGGARGNHLILDDTSQQIQAQLKSDHQCSQLSLGHITRIDDHAGRKDARGEGWELATNAWGVARASRGMLITTEPRPDAASHIKDMGETVQRLSAAGLAQQQLASMAQGAGAQEAEQQTRAADDVMGQAAAIRSGASGNFPELAEPHLVLASPAGIALTTAQSTHIASGGHTAISSQKSLSIASREGLFASVGKTLRLFVHQAGMKLIAAAGKVTVQAQSDNVEVIANKVLELLSESDWVNIRGKKGVRLHGANNMLEIGEQVQFFTAAPVLFHGNLETLPAKSVAQAFNPRTSDYHFDQEVNLLHVDEAPAKNFAYELVRGDGTILDGTTGGDGSTGMQKSAGFDSYTIRYKGELP